MTCMTRSTVQQDVLNLKLSEKWWMTYFRIRLFLYSQSSHVIIHVTRHAQPLLWARDYCGSSYGANTWDNNPALFTFRLSLLTWLGLCCTEQAIPRSASHTAQNAVSHWEGRKLFLSALTWPWKTPGRWQCLMVWVFHIKRKYRRTTWLTV